jgi:dTDP-4-amino-4,6-dideoxygalactose transaminase
LDPVHLAHELKNRRDHIAVVIAVSSFGTPPPASVRQAWEGACAEAEVPLIVDSAAGFGAVSDDGTPIGAQGDVEVVSFHATKPFAIGEGGAMFTRDDRMRARLESAVNFGLNAERRVEFAPGFNGKMSELHAATGLAVLDGFDAALDARRRAVRRVQRQIEHRVSFQAESPRSTWQFMPVAFSSEIERLEAERCCEGAVEVRTYYTPLHTMGPFRQWPVGDLGLEVTDDLVSRLLCLPMAADITDDEADHIAATALRGSTRLEPRSSSRPSS